MAGGIHPDLANDLLDHLLGGGDYTRLGSVYVGLFIVMPSLAGSGFTEASGGGYARQAVTNNATNFPAASSGAKKNGTAISWSAFSAAIGTVLGAGIWDASTSGKLLAWANLSSAIYVASGQGFEIPANGLTFTLKSQGA